MIALLLLMSTDNDSKDCKTTVYGIHLPWHIVGIDERIVDFRQRVKTLRNLHEDIAMLSSVKK